MIKLITRSCLRLLLGRRKLISPGSENFRGLLELCGSPEFGQNLASILPDTHSSSKLLLATEAPKVVLQPRGVNSRVGMRYKIQAPGVPLTDLARDDSNPVVAGGGMLSTRGPRGQIVAVCHGGKGVIYART